MKPIWRYFPVLTWKQSKKKIYYRLRNGKYFYVWVPFNSTVKQLKDKGATYNSTRNVNERIVTVVIPNSRHGYRIPNLLKLESLETFGVPDG